MSIAARFPADAAFVASRGGSSLTGTDTERLANGSYVVIVERASSNSFSAETELVVFSAQGAVIARVTLPELGLRDIEIDATPTGFVASYAQRAIIGTIGGTTEGRQLLTQSFDFAGNPIGPRTTIVTEANTALQNEVAVSGNGTIATVWSSVGGQSGQGFDIRVQLVAADGTRIGGATIVNPTLAGDQTNPAVEALADGGLLVAWQDRMTDGRIVLFAQRLAADGSRVGDSFALASSYVGFQTDVELTRLADDSLVAVWTSREQDILARRLDRFGNPVGSDFAIATTAERENDPQVTAFPGGGFAVSWLVGDIPNGQRLVVRAYAADGTAGPQTLVEVPIPSNADFGKRLPSVAALDNGDLAVTWIDIGRDGRAITQRYTLALQPDVRAGTILDDIMVGDARAERLSAGAGNDALIGGAGDDILAGGAGLDRIDGGAGTDTASYEDATAGVSVDLTRISNPDATAGDTLISIENLTGSTFDDVLIGDMAANRLDGGAGDDRIVTGKGGDVIIGGAGVDTVDYRDSNGTVLVNLTLRQGFANYADSDTYDGVENVIGSNFDDLLIGDAGANRLDGAAGADVLISGKGGDALVGGDGLDTASYVDSEGTVLVNLTTGRGFANSAEGDSYDSIEMVLGSAGDDLLIGDNQPFNRLDGAGGNDTLIGSLGATDELVGGDGIDTVSYEDNQGGVFVNLDTGRGFGNAAEGDRYSSIENVRGGSFADFIIGTQGANRLEGAGGDDVLIGSLGGDLLIGGAGMDTASYEDNWGGVFINLLTGRGFGNAAEGDTFDSVEGLTGSIFADTFIGNDAANRLNGRLGRDTLTGNGGADDFVFDTALNPSTNVDAITDFQPGADRIVLDRDIFFTISLGAFGPNTFINGTAATGGQNRIIYDQATGNLWFDDDGNGTDPAILFAVLENRPVLTAADFLVVA